MFGAEFDKIEKEKRNLSLSDETGNEFEFRKNAKIVESRMLMMMKK